MDSSWNCCHSMWHSFNKKARRSFGRGAHDEEVFKFAKYIIDKNEKEGAPYNITILTLDTHCPYGNPSANCPYKEKYHLSNAVLCSVDEIADLVNYVKNKGYDKNTNIVIVGDHLFPANNAQKVTQFTTDERFIFNRFISDNKFTMNRNNIIGFDIFPTILYSLGFNIQGGKLGLGYSGFGDFKLHPPEDRLQEFNEQLLDNSAVYSDLWNPRKKYTRKSN